MPSREEDHPRGAPASLIVATPTSRHLRAAAAALEVARRVSGALPCRAWVTQVDGADVAAFEAGGDAACRGARRPSPRPAFRLRTGRTDLPSDASYG